MSTKTTKDFSGRVKEVSVHDTETGTLKKIKANDQGALRRAVPPTSELRQNKQPRKRY